MRYPYHIKRLIQIVAASTSRSPHTVGFWATGDGRTYARLVAGADVTTRRAARIMQWFSDHWPAGAQWPADIPRPEPSPGSPAASPPPANGAGDPVAAVKAAAKRMSDAVLTNDFPAMHRAEREKLSIAMQLGPDGQIASTQALCLALGVHRDVCDRVVADYADGRSRAKRTPRKGSRVARMLTALVAAGDRRFTSRRARTAA